MRQSHPGQSFRKSSRRRSRLPVKSNAKHSRHAVESLESRCLLAAGYLEMNLVSNQAGAALLQDPALNLPWGIAVPPTGGNFWIADTGSGAVTIYTGGVNGQPLSENPLVVTIPGGFPTADVFNNTGSTTDFLVSDSSGSSGPATFIFASLDGKISAWSSTVSGSQAQQVAHVNGAYFTGLTIGNNGTSNLLYAADFQNGKIDVFDGNFQPTTLSGSFADPNLPAGYAPFNIQAIDGKLYVTYAVQQASSAHSSDDDGDDQGDHGGGEGEDSASKNHGNGGGGQSDDDADEHNGGGVFTPAATGGIVDVFDMDGNLLNRFATNGTLNAPWGLAVAPAGFGDVGGDLLVGNFGDGRISAFKPDGTPDGQLTNAAGDPISISHLLGLSFGNGTAGDAGTLYFTADAATLATGLSSANNGIVLLDGSGRGALSEVGNASINVGSGAITVDSSNAGAIFLAGNPSLTAAQLNVVGSPGLAEHGHPNVNVGGAVNSGATAVVDPLLSLNAPAPPSNTFAAVNAGNDDSITLQPGLYNGGITVGENATVTLMPGTYYVNGSVSVEGGGTLQGEGVTIYIVSNGGDPALKVAGRGVVDLTAPATGDLQGVAIFLARSNAGGVKIDGRGVVDLTGTLYAPSATVSVSGNGKLLLESDSASDIASELIASDLSVAGNGKVNVGATASHGPFSLFGSLQPASDTTPLTATGASLSATEGFAFQGSVAAFTSSAASAAASDFTATIDWGDGTSTTSGSVKSSGNGGFLVAGHHVYAEEGSYNVVVTVTDKSNNTITAADAVDVADAPLLAVGNRVQVSQGLVATDVTVASFVDTGGADAVGDYTATIDWGDGATSTGTVSISNGTLNVVGSHTYSATGHYPVKVTIQDEGGATATANSVALLGSSAFNSDDVFVGDAFEDILERAADRASQQFFVNALQNGMTRQQFASLLTHSNEYLGGKIQQAYQHYLGRGADNGGLAYWLALLRGGLTEEQLEANFIGSAEFFEHAGGTNKAWVDEMYFDLLGRLPDAQGEAYWIQVLSGGAARSSVAFGFAASSEREGMKVKTDYQTFLGRDPGSSEVNHWVNSFHNGTTNEQVVAGFVGSQEYFSHHGGNHGGGNGNHGGGKGNHGGD